MPSIDRAKILIIASDGSEQSELMQPRDDLAKAGAIVHVATPDGSDIRGWDKTDWGETVPADIQITAAQIDQYDALVLPGGQINPDTLRADADVVQKIADFAATGKPVAAICHAPWLLIEAGLVRGKRLTSFKSIRTDLRNAGADVVDEDVAQDGNLITSRNPGDLDAFSKAIIAAVEKGVGSAKAARFPHHRPANFPPDASPAGSRLALKRPPRHVFLKMREGLSSHGDETSHRSADRRTRRMARTTILACAVCPRRAAPVA